MKQKAIFLDRDGTINVDKGYVYRIEDFEFIKGVPETLVRMKNKDFLIIVITNQSGIARGYYTEDDVLKLHLQINDDLFNNYGIRIDKFYYCPHHYKEGFGKYKVQCECRKPNSALIEQAIKEFDIDINKSYMIGDKESDNILIDGLKFLMVSEVNTLETISKLILK